MLPGSVAAVVLLIRPLFGYYTPETLGGDFENHVALVAGALDTWRTTRALPISSNQLVPGIEYPYYLFGNGGFYVIASLISYLLTAPANFGAAITLAAGLVAGQVGAYLLARSFGLNRVYSAAIGFLYAAGPYLCVNLLVRVAFPEFLAWELLPLLCFLARRSMQPGAGVWWVVAAGTVMSLALYMHKLVGPHIILFGFALILVNARRSLGWLARLLVLGVSVPALTVFGWAPILRLPRDQIVTLEANKGIVSVFNNSLLNFLWPWAQNSLPPIYDEPPYAHRFALQIGLLASIGLAYGVWRLVIRSRFRPRHRELYVALIGGVAYSVLVLGVGGLIGELPFPLNTIQFSYRLMGLAHFAGVLALIASLAEARCDSTTAAERRRGHVVAVVVGVLTLGSVVTYWRPPALTNLPQSAIRPFYLNDTSAFLSKSLRSLLDTSGSIGPNGSLSATPFLIGLRGAIERVPAGSASLVPPETREKWPRTLFLRGQVQPDYFVAGGPNMIVRVYAVRTSTDPPCANASDFPVDQPDLITQLIARCAAVGLQGSKALIALNGGPRIAKLLEDQTFTAPGPLDLRVTVPDEFFFMAIECTPKTDAGSTVVTSRPGATCLNVDYFGPANQLDGSVQTPRSIPTEAWQRGPLGQLTIHMTNQPSGDYLVPTFDYPFVRIARQDGAEVPEYQFDRQPVIRFDGKPETYSVVYDLSAETTVFTVGVYVVAGLLMVYVLFQRFRAVSSGSRRPWRTFS